MLPRSKPHGTSIWRYNECQSGVQRKRSNAYETRCAIGTRFHDSSIPRIESEFQDNVRVVHGFAVSVIGRGAEKFKPEAEIETPGDIIMAAGVNPKFCRACAARDMANVANCGFAEDLKCQNVIGNLIAPHSAVKKRYVNIRWQHLVRLRYVLPAPRFVQRYLQLNNRRISFENLGDRRKLLSGIGILEIQRSAGRGRADIVVNQWHGNYWTATRIFLSEKAFKRIEDRGKDLFLDGNIW